MLFGFKHFIFITSPAALILGCETVETSIPSSDIAQPTLAVFTAGDDYSLAVEEYWTPEAKASAIPIETPELSEEELLQLLLDYSPDEYAPVLTDPAEFIDEAVDENDAALLGTPRRVDVDKHPFSTAGMLYFTKNDKRYRCTAQFVGRYNLLLTAAHCLMSKNGSWATRFVFERAYKNGSGKENFYPKCIAAWNEATQNGDYNWRYDYGFIKTTRSNGVGHMGVQANTRSNTWTSIGYPSNFDNGQYLLAVSGRRGRQGTGVVEFIGNPMRSGSSGGAWIDGLDSLNYTVGLNSFSYTSDSRNSWGPNFDNTFWRLYTNAKKDNCGL